jgi:hypothetical protein
MALLAWAVPPVRCNGTVVMSDLDNECPGPDGARLTWALELVIDDESLDEPLEIGWSQAEAVIQALPEVSTHAMSDSTFSCKRRNGSLTPTNERKALSAGRSLA